LNCKFSPKSDVKFNNIERALKQALITVSDEYRQLRLTVNSQALPYLHRSVGLPGSALKSGDNTPFTMSLAVNRSAADPLSPPFDHVLVPGHGLFQGAIFSSDVYQSTDAVSGQAVFAQVVNRDRDVLYDPRLEYINNVDAALVRLLPQSQVNNEINVNHINPIVIRNIAEAAVPREFSGDDGADYEEDSYYIIAAQTPLTQVSILTSKSGSLTMVDTVGGEHSYVDMILIERHSTSQHVKGDHALTKAGDSGGLLLRRVGASMDVCGIILGSGQSSSVKRLSICIVAPIDTIFSSFGINIPSRILYGNEANPIDQAVVDNNVPVTHSHQRMTTQEQALKSIVEAAKRIRSEGGRIVNITPLMSPSQDWIIAADVALPLPENAPRNFRIEGVDVLVREPTRPIYGRSKRMRFSDEKASKLRR